MLSPIKHENPTSMRPCPFFKLASTHVFVLIPSLVYTLKQLRIDWTYMQAHVILCDLSHMYIVIPLNTCAVIQRDLAPYISACVFTQVSVLCM